MRTKTELDNELLIIKDKLIEKPQSEFYKAYKLCLEWVLNE